MLSDGAWVAETAGFDALLAVPDVVIVERSECENDGVVDFCINSIFLAFVSQTWSWIGMPAQPVASAIAW